MRLRLLSQLAALAAVVAVVTTAMAADKAAPTQALRDKLAKQFPEVKITDIRNTPATGIYELSIGGDVGYVTADGKYLIHGDLIDLGTQANLTEVRRQDYRKKVLADIGEQNMIVFSPKNPKYTVTVFTDVDCGYCRMLHSQISGYQAQGIAVRYVFFPRAGLGSESFKKAESVWCAKDRRDALTRAKKGETLAPAHCKTPVAREYQAAMDLGVRGTPAIIAQDGRLIAGYMPPENLKQALQHPEQ